MKKRTIFSALKYIIFLSFGLGLLYYVTKSQDIGKLLEEFRTANYFWIVAAMFFGAISHISRSIRWNILIKSIGYHSKLSTTFYAVMTGYFANMLVPRLGEVSRCGVLSKNSDIPFNKLLGTVVAERIFDALCLLLLIVLVIFFQFSYLQEFLNDFIFNPLSLSFENNFFTFIIVAVVIVAFIIGIYILYKATNRHMADKPFIQKLRRVLAGFSEGIKSFRHIEQKGLFILHTLIIWMMYFLMTYLCFFSLSATSHLSIADGFTILVMGSLGVVAPVPGGIGAYHFVVITTMVELFGINASSATSFAYISHTSQGVLITVLGFWAFAALFFRNKKKQNAKS